MASVRQRRMSKTKEPNQEQHKQEVKLEAKTTIHKESGVWNGLSVLVGCLLAASLGLVTSIYVATLHENDLWFSNIKEVEREISFRTECGLYYSYYKQMLNAPSIQQGLYELINDNITESRRTINILQRMNIYQEVVLAIFYHILPMKTYLEPVYFYIYTVFGLQTITVIALYATSWFLSGTWLAGMLAGLWYIINRVDTTRVEFTIPLRENWSLPFFSVQIAAITYYLRPQLKPLNQILALSVIFISTFIFSLTWQFNQFILLMQALALFTLDSIGLISSTKVTHLYMVQAGSLLLVWVLQFFSSMILGSLVLSFIVSALIIKSVQKNMKMDSFLGKILKLLFHVFSVLILTLLIHYTFKKTLQLKSDEHIFKFITAKFGFGSTRDFDAKLYLCEEAFGVIPLDTFERFLETLVLYPYVCTICILTILTVITTFWNFRNSSKNLPEIAKTENMLQLRQDIAYNFAHTVIFGILACSTMRMKYIWTGHMCAFAAYGVCSNEMWGLFLKMFRLHTIGRERLIRLAVPCLILAFLYYKFFPKLMDEISELREFYDPDTVELMNWINTKTPTKAVFAGSMQLLAGVKLCTGRILTNHPHYEDKILRDRTQQVYQIYARQDPKEVHRILRSFGTDYVIIEDSICYERRHNRGCRLRDLLDVANGHIMDGPGENDPDLKPSTHPRFCDEIKLSQPSYTLYFTQVFRNKTFHVYKLKKNKKKAA
ncbi:probable C-mannosyltransferase DPY19L3 [Polypterus senegalus]|uniref:probable C-mannosyltransferase DPY19L3 n=1 Tax=Polypterus senegalus TaxID=55291 RepID=UPI0019655D51|nr:probable C-mannosyltransferase DPY19L3 [Polypterus senegalus]